VNQQSSYQWRWKYQDMGLAELRRLKQLEEENRKLKRLVADLSLDKRMLQAVLAKNREPDAQAGTGALALYPVHGRHREPCIGAVHGMEAGVDRRSWVKCVCRVSDTDGSDRGSLRMATVNTKNSVHKIGGRSSSTREAKLV
jgi:hypothetical protein